MVGAQSSFLILVVMDEHVPIYVLHNLSYDPVVLHSVEFLLQFRLEVEAALARCVDRRSTI